MELQLGRDHACDVFGVCCGTSATAVDVGRNEMNFFAIFVGDSGAGGGTSICTENYTILYIYIYIYIYK